MAEGGGHKDRSDFLMSGSDFSYDFYCELCKDEGLNVEADGFCVDCKEYLCSVCYNSHKKTRQTRLHELLDKQNMPTDKPLSADRVSIGISTKCTIHPGDPVKFYCNTHDFLGCSTCFATDHRSCFQTESILKKSENILDSKEYAEFIKNLKSLHQKSCGMIAKSCAVVTQTKLYYSDVITSVKQFREKLLKTLDIFERNIIEEAQAFVTNTEMKMTPISEDCISKKGTVESIIAEFKSLQSSRQVCQVYISMKENNKNIKTLQDNLRSAEEGLIVQKFCFEPNRKLQDFIESPHFLGKISREVDMIVEKQKSIDTRYVPMTATRLADINLNSKRDKRSMAITGSAVLSTNMLIIVDNSNCKVKLLDTKANTLMHELKLSSQSWDVTAVSSNQAAITNYNRNKILLLRVSEPLSIEREISVDGHCRGLAYNNDRLVVAYASPPKVEIMDMHGNVMKRIKTDGDGNELFIRPQYVCVSRDGDTMYISDYTRNEVISLTMDGVVKSVYSDNELKGPQKVCVDHHDHVYVCGYASRNVHMLTADLTRIQIILTEEDGLNSNVFSVSHCQETNRLYLGMQSPVAMKVFQLS